MTFVDCPFTEQDSAKVTGVGTSAETVWLNKNKLSVLVPLQLHATKVCTTQTVADASGIVEWYFIVDGNVPSELELTDMLVNWRNVKLVGTFPLILQPVGLPCWVKQQ